MTTLRERFTDSLDFPLDDFQIDGIEALERGHSVLVAAPTGAGKTVIGEFAVFQALQRGGKCFYTTPIKALSNQKYADLVARHGARDVGLLTGDRAVNGDAPIVVMTTEVLRNMLYEGSRALVGLHTVVLDEVHYLADRERGAVWEEVIVQLPESVALACLSATVGNAEEFGAWLHEVRDGCDVIISEHRPVPLEHHYAVGDRLEPVFAAGKAGGRKTGGGRRQAARQARAGVPNPELVMLERRAATLGPPNRRGRRYPGVRLRAPRRSDLVPVLARRGWLPAIWFIFSRSGCDRAVTQLLDAGVSLTTGDERRRIRNIVEERTAGLDPDDLDVLGFPTWSAGLARGIASHHAGMVPVFKEVVEKLFVQGLVKVCFATETLALGINMPARTVVLERLEKFDGTSHELLTPGQFTQLTGRAGRRGLDPVGHAVVVHQRDVEFTTVASLVGRRTESLRSSFAPSYNMAVNLLRRHDRAAAEALLAQSFAQYQTDAGARQQTDRLAQLRAALEGYRDRVRSEYGDVESWWSLRRRLERRTSEKARRAVEADREAMVEAVAALRPGDVVALPTGGSPDLVAVVERSVSRAGTPLARAVGTDRKVRKLGPREFIAPPQRLTRLRLPEGGGPRDAPWRIKVAGQLRELPPPSAPGEPEGNGDADVEVERLRRELAVHPVAADPAIEELEVWAGRADGVQEDVQRLERSLARRTGSLVRRFDRIVGVLRDLGYLAGSEDAPGPTADGLRLSRLYAETDLVLAECLRRGVLQDLDVDALAATASAFVYETRQRDPAPPRPPTARVREALDDVDAVWADVSAREDDAGLPMTRRPDAGVSDVVWRWARGAELDEALGTSELTPGDFVRTIKQVADLLGQLRDALDHDDPVGRSARSAAGRLLRGVITETET